MKNPPSAYIQKLKSYLDTGGVSRKVRGPRCTPVPWSPCQAGHRHGANRCPRPTVQEASAGVHAGAPGAGDFPEDQLHRVRVGVASSPSRCHCLRGGDGCAAGSGWRVIAGCGGCGLILPSWGGSDGRLRVLRQLAVLWGLNSILALWYPLGARRDPAPTLGVLTPCGVVGAHGPQGQAVLWWQWWQQWQRWQW